MGQDQNYEKDLLMDVVPFLSVAPEERSDGREEFLFSPSIPLPWRLALWLDYFLANGGERMKEQWSQLSPEEQQDLGLEILRCYLSQPLFVRLSPEQRDGAKNQALSSKKVGKLVQMVDPFEATPTKRYFYPLAHQRLWPVLLDVLKDVLSPTKEMSRRLHPALTMASSSRLENLRKRAETLSAYIRKGESGIPAPDRAAEEHWVPKETLPLVSEEIPAQAKEEIPVHIPVEPTLSVPAEESKPPSSSSRRKKKKKSSDDQLKLF